MSLRQARFDDHWCRTFLRNYPTRFTQISFTNLRCLADATLHFSGGMTAIVGSNGVGKSTLIGAIAELLTGEPDSVSYEARLGGSSNRGTAFIDDAELCLEVGDGEAGRRVTKGDIFRGESRWLDPSHLAGRCLSQIANDHNFDDLLEPVTPQRLTSTELKIASYLVGKSYTDVRIFEISDYGGLDRFPYFRASSAGVSYGSEAMGRGELSLLLSYWTLKDLPKNSILILEEPETHVSPRSQDCLMNIVAKFCDEMGIWVIITTHSPTIIRRIPNEHLVLFARDNGPSALVKNANKLDIAVLLGGGVAFSGALLVEDEGAQGFVVTMLEELAPDVLRQFEVVIAGSESRITAALKAMPATRGWLSLIGAYDGDVRAVITGAELKWPFRFLPGHVAPEQLLIDMVGIVQGFAELLATELHRMSEHIVLALNHAAGADLHDYLGQIAAVLNLDVPTVRRSFVRIWLKDDANLALARQFTEEVQSAANR